MPGFPVHQGIATPEPSSLLKVTLSTGPPLEAETSGQDLGRRGPQAGLGSSQVRSRSRVWPAPCPLRLEGTEALVGLCG